MRDLWIVVVHYRTPELLRRLLESLREGSFLERTLVVDCASPEFDEAAFRDRFPARFVRLPVNRGYAFAVNRGIAQTPGNPILLLNADVLLSAKDIEDLLAIWNGLNRPAALGPLHRNAEGRPQLTYGSEPTLWNEWRRGRLEQALRRGVPAASRRVERTCRGTREVSWVSGSCMFMDRGAIQAAGLWDEDYFLYFEDMEWCLRTAQLGYRIYHTGEVSVLHEHGASMATSPQNAEIAYRQSQLRFFSSRWGPLLRDLLYVYLRCAKRLHGDDLRYVQRLGPNNPTSRRPRVLHVVASLEGGAAEHVRLLARAQIRRGGDVWVCTALNDGRTALPETWSGIPLTGCDFGPKSLWRGIRQLRGLILRGQWSVVHLHGHRAGAIARTAMFLLSDRPRVVITYHGYHPPHYRSWWSQIGATSLERLLRRQTDHFIAVSPSTARDVIHWVEIDAARISMIPNGIDPEEYEHARAACREKVREELGLAPEEFAVLCVGRLHRQKGVRYFLEALTELNRSQSERYGTRKAVHRVRGFIAGDGPEREDLASQFASCLPQDVCVFLGWRDDVPNLLAAADLLVLPSLWEGCPLVVLQAWAAGVPVVATDVIGTNDIIVDGENGFLVPACNPAALVVAIARIHRRPALADHLVRNGRASLGSYSLDAMVDQTMRIYEPKNDS